MGRHPGGLRPVAVGDLSAVGQQGDLVVEDLHETAVDGQSDLITTLGRDDRAAGGQCRHRRFVVGQDADLALGGARDEHLRLTRPDDRFGGHHLE